MIMESSEQTPLLASERPYNLGVALSGGGARGFAHAGARVFDTFDTRLLEFGT